MSNHWSYEAKRPQGGIILISLLANGEKIGLLYGLDKTIEEYARLIIAAPELYELVKEELIPTSDYGGTLSFSREAKIRAVLNCIDGKAYEA